jgi:GTPase SAR1 family protein/Leucine-rich repeat (LRR) protein
MEIESLEKEAQHHISGFAEQWPSKMAFKEAFIGEIDGSSGVIHLTIEKKKSARYQHPECVNLSPLVGIPNLVELNVYGFKVCDPKVLTNFAFLEVLSLRSSNLCIHIFEERLDHLLELSIFDSMELKAISLTKFPSLKKFSIDNKEMKNLISISGKSKIESLEVSNSRLLNLGFAENFSNLQHFHLEGSQHLDLRPIKKLRNLKTIHLKNVTSDYWDSLGSNDKLVSIKISSGKIKDINFIKSLPNLKELCISGNKIEDIEVLGGLKGVLFPDLTRNPIKSMSPEVYAKCFSISSLTNLGIGEQIEIVRMMKNRVVKAQKYEDAARIRDLEKALINAEHVKLDVYKRAHQIFLRFCIDSHDLFSPPLKILYEGEDAILNYYRALEEDGAIPNDHSKVIVLGNSTAGKSSLIRFLVEDTYSPNESSTHGITYRVWHPFSSGPSNLEVANDVGVCFWDFGGQEFYHATHSLFFSDESLYLVLFEEATNFQGRSLTRIHLYENGEVVLREVELEHFDYRYWLDNIHYLASKKGQLIMLIQTKCDSQRWVEISDDCRAKFELSQKDHIFHISTKGAWENEPTQTMEFELFRQKLLAHVTERIQRFSNSKKWQEIKNNVQNAWNKENVLNYDVWIQRCQAIKPTIDDRDSENAVSQLDTLTQQLHNQGILLHFRGIKALRNKVFVNPEWLTDCIYRVLDYGVMRNEGRFDDSHLVDCAARIGLVTGEELNALLVHFGLVFEIIRTGKRYFIAPQYLPNTFNAETAMVVSAFEQTTRPIHCFTVSFPHFLPAHVFLRFLAHYGTQHLNYWYNRNELVFVKDGKTVFAKCIRDAPTRQISIAIQGGNEALTFELFQEVAKSFNGNDVSISLDGVTFELITDILNPKFEKVYRADYWFVWGDKKPTRKGLPSTSTKNSQLGCALFAFASDYTLAVNKELDHIRAAANQCDRLEATYLEHANLESLPDRVSKLKKDIVMFHFAGHAKGGKLYLQEGQELQQQRLLRILTAKGHRLAFVFLNACKTLGYALDLLNEGVKAVLVTSVDIQDEKAARFAAQFYSSFLIDGQTLKNAFDLGDAAGGESKVGEILPIILGRKKRLLSIDSAFVLVLQAHDTPILEQTLEQIVGEN